MIHKTGGIVLHRFKYSDSKVIAKIFTEEFGLQSYMFFGANSRASDFEPDNKAPFVIPYKAFPFAPVILMTDDKNMMLPP